jgi:hypothetical protein
MVAGRPDGSGPYLLRSPWQGTLWQTPLLRADAVPAADNPRGIYALTRYATARPLGFGRTVVDPILVRGQVRLSGTVVEHEDGTVRAEEAEVVRLTLSTFRGALTAHDQRPIPMSLLRVRKRFEHEGAILLDLQPADLLRSLLRTYNAQLLAEWPWEGGA